MRNADLVNNFINGACEGKGSNLKIEGNQLINYTTCIAYRIGNTVYLNNTKYSSTTSVHQNRIRREAYNVVEMSEEELKRFVYESFSEVI